MASDGGAGWAVLRPWRADDAADLRAAFVGADDLVRQFGGLDLADPAVCNQFIAEQLLGRDVSARQFAIAVEDKAVGNVAVTNIEHRHATAWVSYWLAVDARGHGWAARAVATAAAWAYADRQLVRLELGHRTDNPASCAVARRAGFAAEGIERSKLAYGDLRFDVETHARLRDDPDLELELLPVLSS